MTMNYTHAFINSSQRVVSVENLSLIAYKSEVQQSGFLLIYDADRVKYDQHGRPCRSAGGWSYGHIQRGHICAGAGGLNSLPVMKIHSNI